MIYQINVWTCEVCGATVTTGEETFPYSDPVVMLEHEEWGYIGEMFEEKHVCQICLNKK